MRWMCCAMVAVTALSTHLFGEGRRAGRTENRTQRDENLDARTYPVADVVVPLDSRKDAVPNFAALERHLKDVTGGAGWANGASIKRYEQTLSLVVRQTPSVHEQIAKELGRLRGELDVQCSIEFRVITGPRSEIAALAEAFPGELGRFETEQLIQRVAESKVLKTVMTPKVTVFSRQTAQLTVHDRTISANATVAADRRSVTLKVIEGAESDQDLLADLQMVTLHSGRSAALRFEAARAGGIIPPAADAEERLLIATPRVLIVEEVEEKLPKTALLTMTPGFVIVEEEEELLGIPTE